MLFRILYFVFIDVLNTINAETDFPNDKTQNKEVHFFMFRLLKMQKKTVLFFDNAGKGTKFFSLCVFKNL